jgi:hypothetical protein
LALIFVFLDGCGLGEPAGHNPFWVQPAPFLRRLLGAPLTQAAAQSGPRLLLRGLDAGLGVAGAPQSATGQTALFTGVNAPALLGEHLTAFPNARLREVIAERSFLKLAAERGHTATFANAYNDLYWQYVDEKRLRHSATTLTNLAAGLPFRTFDDLRAGHAVYWDITHATLRARFGHAVPYRRPEAAGAILAELGRSHALVLFESFLTDWVGHRRLAYAPRWMVGTLDRFLGGLVGALGPADSLLVSSDHGNFEDARSPVHTENPVPLLVVGPAAPTFAGAARITDIAPTILSYLDGNHAGAIE